MVCVGDEHAASAAALFVHCSQHKVHIHVLLLLLLNVLEVSTRSSLHGTRVKGQNYCKINWLIMSLTDFCFYFDKKGNSHHKESKDAGACIL